MVVGYHVTNTLVWVCVFVCVCCVQTAEEEEEEEKEEEMPREAKLHMRNIGKNTPTSSSPNSFGKTARAFSDVQGMYKKEQTSWSWEHTPVKYIQPR